MQGLIVGPTPNPSVYSSSMILFNKYDFPVQYFPATAITPTSVPILDKNSFASSLITNPARIK